MELVLFVITVLIVITALILLKLLCGWTMCDLGIHIYRCRTKFYPSIHAEIVDRYDTVVKCIKCGRTHELTRHDWDDEQLDFVCTKLIYPQKKH